MIQKLFFTDRFKFIFTVLFVLFYSINFQGQVSNFGNVNYVERATPISIAQNVQIANGNNFADSWIEYEITSAATSETLSVIRSVSPINTIDVVSIVGNNVHIGNGTGNKIIGTIDPTFNGLNGQKLRINFSSPLTNSGFTAPITGNSIPGWQVNQGAVTNSALFTRTQGNPVNITGSGPYTITRPGFYSFLTDVNYNPASTAEWGNEGVVRGSNGGWDGTPTTAVTVVNDPTTQDGRALQLTTSGGVPSPNSGSYGSAFGPEVYSDTFAASAGDQLALDWRAQAAGDDYEVYGYLLNVDNGVRTLLFYGRGGNQGWTAASGTIPATGNYQFNFINGTYDRTGGYAVGSVFLIDNIRVLTQDGTDAVASAVARLVTYENSSCDPSVNKTITLRARNTSGNIVSGSNNVSISLVNCAPTITSIAAAAQCEGTTINRNITVNDLDNTAASLIVSATSSNTTVIPNANITFSGSGFTKTMSITSLPGITGSSTITVLVQDPDGATATTSFTITISNLDISYSPTYTLPPGVAINPVIAPTVSGTATSWSISPTSLPNGVVFNTSTGVLSGTSSGFFVDTTYTVTAVNSVCSDTASFILISNNPPTISSISNTTNCLNQPTPAIPFTIADDLTPVANLTVSGTSSNTALVTNSNIVFGGSGANRTVTVTPVTGQFGTTTIAVTVRDQYNATATTSFNITFDDTVAPTVVVQNITVQLDAAGNATLAASQINNGSSDNCAIGSITVAPNTFTGTNLGNNTVTLSVTDQKGNVSTQTATVNIIDVTPPTITTTNSPNDPEVDSYTCGSTFNFNAGLSSCVALVSIAKPIWADNVGVVSRTQTASNGVALTNFGDIVFGNFPVGTTVVTFTATDSSGNITTCQVTIRVSDTQLPIITNCASNFSVNNTTGRCNTLVNLTIPTAGDNCSVATVTYQTSGATTLNGNNFPNALTLNVGITTIVYTVTDASGNIVQCSYNVTVLDNEKPVIACAVSNQQLNAVLGLCSYTHSGTSWNATATDNCSATVAYALTGATTGNGSNLNGVLFNIGTTTVTWTATDLSGNTETCSFNVVVTDNQLPVIANTPTNIITNNAVGNCNAVATWTAPTASDNCNIATFVSTHNSGDVFPVGTTTVTYTATDIHNNVATTSFTVTINDTQLPVIANTPTNITANNDLGNCSAVVTWTAPTASDNCNIANFVSTHNSGALFPVGTTTVTYTATDIHNNVATTSFNVTINDTQVPIIANTPANITANNDLGNCSAVVTWTAPTASDNCSIANFVSTHNSGALFPVGTTTVTYTATDIHNNVATSSFNVTINDTQVPVIANTPANITANNDLDICSAVVTWTAPTASDNCNIATLVSTHNSGALFPVGTTTVTYTATDIYNNVATTTFTVTIVDNQLPIITNIPSSVTVNNDPGNCSAVVTWAAPTASDNCSITTFVSTHNSGAVFPVGTTTVTWTATDASGNMQTASQQVTVRDVSAPIVLTKPITISLNASGQASINPNDVNNGSSDNCGIASITSSKSNFTCSDIGTNTVLVTVTDIHGNTATNTAIVTVVDTTAPTVITRNINVVLNALGQVTITSGMINNGSFDNCGINSIALNITNLNCSNIGNNTVTLTVTDTNGNISTRTAVVNVAIDTRITPDNDSDGIPNICDQDDDNDGVTDTNDNCTLTSNSDQLDIDNDGQGDVCDQDDDNDGILDIRDNCPLTSNPLQEDRDNDGKGNVCDTVEINVSQAITPNGDGINDTWAIYNIENYPNTTVRVFNRWGKEVYYSTNYKNDWDGFYRDFNESLPGSSSYFYQIDLNSDGSIDSQGWLMITK